MSDLPSMYTLHGVLIYIKHFALDCFGCRERYAPDVPLIPMLCAQTPAHTLHLASQQMTNTPIYEISVGGNHGYNLKEADAQGWRKITMYGKTVYVCPACREVHKRSRPEWERRLTDE